MNKIQVEEKNFSLQEEEVFIESSPEELYLTIQGNVTCLLKQIENKTIQVLLKPNSHLLMEFVGTLKNSKTKIVFVSEENTSLDFHLACTYHLQNEMEITSQVTSSNTKNTILVRAIEQNGSFLIKATGDILKNTVNNKYQEEIKAITSSFESITIEPNLKVSTNFVDAVHNAVISPVNEEELFYLKSKGLSDKTSTSLIKEGFLKGIITHQEEFFRR